MHNPTQASATAAKAEFDKFVLDKAEEKAEFDKVLQLSTDQAAAQKAIADKALLDVGEMQVRRGSLSHLHRDQTHWCRRDVDIIYTAWA